MNIALIVIGIYFVVFAFVMTGNDFISKIVCQVIPFFCGLFCIFYAVVNMGIININL